MLVEIVQFIFTISAAVLFIILVYENEELKLKNEELKNDVDFLKIEIEFMKWRKDVERKEITK